jgi:hypothetical protein
MSSLLSNALEAMGSRTDGVRTVRPAMEQARDKIEIFKDTFGNYFQLETGEAVPVDLGLGLKNVWIGERIVKSAGENNARPTVNAIWQTMVLAGLLTGAAFATEAANITSEVVFKRLKQ